MLEDAKLLWRVQRGDRDALRTLYEKYEGDLLTLAANLLRDPATAEDVVQDVFVALARSARRLKLRRTLQAYLATAVANRVRDHYRRGSRSGAMPIDEAGHIATGGDGPVQMAIQTEQIVKIRAAVDELPYEQREAVMLRVHADMRFREIATHQRVSVKTAISRYRYGLKKLRSALNAEVSL
jgi:RNA polymerase sigma-70 factor (ECF subfamily)